MLCGPQVNNRDRKEIAPWASMQNELQIVIVKPEMLLIVDDDIDQWKKTNETMANKYMKGCLTWLEFREMQPKTTIGHTYYFERNEWAMEGLELLFAPGVTAEWCTTGQS